MIGLEAFVREPRVAYFSMEIALQSDVPTYGGGLGVLAGDTMRSAADLGLPIVGVTLVSRAGYLRQRIEHGQQVEVPDLWAPERFAQRLAARVALPVGSREVWIGAWLYTVESPGGGAVPVILLDTDLPENDPRDRELTHALYGGDEAYRLHQEIVLGIGGVRMLDALGFTVRKYHLNEGHAALLCIELLHRFARVVDTGDGTEPEYDVPAVRQRCAFTTHTPVEAGHDQFHYELADPLLRGIVDTGQLRELAGTERLNMTRLALNLSGRVNGVALRHAEVSRRMFPGYDVRAIVNGVHPWTWTSDSFRRLYDRHVPHWWQQPELLVRAELIDDDALLRAHAEAKQALIERVRDLTGESLDADVALLGFARRMTPYKRADLLFADLERLKAIARNQPFQIVMAGKAHPRDTGGKALIAKLHEWANALHGAVRVVFVPGYDMDLARSLVSGVDVWLNLPLRPLEASGTSGMKAAFNGVPSLSVLDGWWLEGWIEGVTGWAVGGDAETDNALDAVSLYDKLERKVLPLYYGERAGWAAIMKGAISRNAPFFNSHRMMRRYAAEAYAH